MGSREKVYWLNGKLEALETWYKFLLTRFAISADVTSIKESKKWVKWKLKAYSYHHLIIFSSHLISLHNSLKVNECGSHRYHPDTSLSRSETSGGKPTFLSTSPLSGDEFFFLSQHQFFKHQKNEKKRYRKVNGKVWSCELFLGMKIHQIFLMRKIHLIIFLMVSLHSSFYMKLQIGEVCFVMSSSWILCGSRKNFEMKNWNIFQLSNT